MGVKDVITIALIDDHKLFREGVNRILSYGPTFDVIAEADDGRVAKALLEEHELDVVLMDINIPVVNGIEATRDLNKHYPNTKVIIFSIQEDETYVTHALQSDAQGYLIKQIDTQSLMEAIKVFQEGGSYLHPKITHNLLEEYRKI